MNVKRARLFLLLAALISSPLRAETKAQKMEALVQEADVKKIKSMIIKNRNLASASYGPEKDSLLIVALKSGRGLDVIKLLLDAGVSPKAQNANGDNAVSAAARVGADPKVLDALISYDTVLPFQRKNRILKKNNEGKSALDYAAENPDSGQEAVIKRYLGIVEKTEEEAAPLPEPPARKEEAAQAEEGPAPAEEIAQEEEAAEEEAAPVPEEPQDERPLSPPDSAALQEAAKAASANAADPYRRIYLFEGIEAFDTYDEKQEKKRDLIAEPNKAGKGGRTLLHKAAAEDDAEMILLLKDSGADFKLADGDGYTPLMYAARFAKKAETASLLLQFGADAKAKNRYGLSAIEIAAADNKSPPLVRALLEKSAKADNKKAYITAVGLGRPDAIIQEFFDAGFSPNEIYKGKSALMYAAESNSHTDCIRLLLEKGADKSMLTSDWKNAFWFASRNPALPKNDVYWALNDSEKN